jgi:hypothetical protein
VQTGANEALHPVSFSNGMGDCWTCLGGGAWFTVAKRNEFTGKWVMALDGPGAGQ